MTKVLPTSPQCRLRGVSMMPRWFYGQCFLLFHSSRQVNAKPCYLDVTSCVPIYTSMCLTTKVTFTHTSLNFTNETDAEWRFSGLGSVEATSRGTRMLECYTSPSMFSIPAKMWQWCCKGKITYLTGFKQYQNLA